MKWIILFLMINTGKTTSKRVKYKLELLSPRENYIKSQLKTYRNLHLNYRTTTKYSTTDLGDILLRQVRIRKAVSESSKSSSSDDTSSSSTKSRSVKKRKKKRKTIGKKKIFEKKAEVYYPAYDEYKQGAPMTFCNSQPQPPPMMVGMGPAFPGLNQYMPYSGFQGPVYTINLTVPQKTTETTIDPRIISFYYLPTKKHKASTTKYKTSTTEANKIKLSTKTTKTRSAFYSTKPSSKITSESNTLLPSTSVQYPSRDPTTKIESPTITGESTTAGKSTTFTEPTSMIPTPSTDLTATTPSVDPTATTASMDPTATTPIIDPTATTMDSSTIAIETTSTTEAISRPSHREKCMSNYCVARYQPNPGNPTTLFEITYKNPARANNINFQNVPKSSEIFDDLSDNINLSHLLEKQNQKTGYRKSLSILNPYNEETKNSDKQDEATYNYNFDLLDSQEEIDDRAKQEIDHLVRYVIQGKKEIPNLSSELSTIEDSTSVYPSNSFGL